MVTVLFVFADPEGEYLWKINDFLIFRQRALLFILQYNCIISYPKWINKRFSLIYVIFKVLITHSCYLFYILSKLDILLLISLQFRVRAVKESLKQVMLFVKELDSWWLIIQLIFALRSFNILVEYYVMVFIDIAEQFFHEGEDVVELIDTLQGWVYQFLGLLKPMFEFLN